MKCLDAMLRKRAIKSSFRDLKANTKAARCYKTYAILCFAEECDNQEAGITELPTLTVENIFTKSVCSPPGTVKIYDANGHRQEEKQDVPRNND